MKGTLKLKARDVVDGDGTVDDDPAGIEIDVLDLRLPCRLYEVGYQVAEAGRFTLTTEFLLRLLKAVGGTSEADIAEFFGFSAEEAAHVVSAAERKDLVQRRGGRVHLTDAGERAFDKGGEEPELYEVERKKGWFWFDLVSFCPIRADHLQGMEKTFPEVPIRHPEAMSNASEEIRKGFRRHFHELQAMHGSYVGEKSSPYTVDHVIGQRRSYALVPMSVSVRRESPETVEPDLLGWKSGNDLDNRIDVLESCGAFLRTAQVAASYGEGGGAELLMRCAPAAVAHYFKGSKFDPRAFFRFATAQAGDLRKDRRTARIYGTLWTQRNRARMAAAIQHSPPCPSSERGPIIWLQPAHPYWGCSTKLVTLLESLAKTLAPSGDSEPMDTVLLSHDDRDTVRRFGDVFSAVAVLRDRKIPKNFEMLLVPGRVFAALSYAPLSEAGGYPMPLGVVSFDPVFIKAAHEVMSDIIAFGRPVVVSQGWKGDIVEQLLDALHLPDNFGQQTETALAKDETGPAKD